MPEAGNFEGNYPHRRKQVESNGQISHLPTPLTLGGGGGGWGRDKEIS